MTVPVDAIQAPVFYETSQIGQLSAMGAGEIAFRYDSRWSRTPGAFPLSTRFALTEEGQVDIGSWLANLLPEEQTLNVLAGRIGVDRRDVYALLLSVGQDTAGAFSFGCRSDPARWRYEPLLDYMARSTGRSGLSEDDALALMVETLPQRPFLFDEADETGVRISLAGGQTKAALALIDPEGRPVPGLWQGRQGLRLAVPLGGAPTTVILKPASPRLPGIVENEAFCLELARQIGLPVADSEIRRTSGSKLLAVARYDRRQMRDGRIRRMHQEDFAQALGVLPQQKYETSTGGGPTMRDILSVSARLSSPRCRLALQDALIFNILIGNTDAHAKNYSILFTPEPSLAPLYDLTSSLPWADTIIQTCAQKIAGKKRRPADLAGRHWRRIAGESGLNPREFLNRVGQIGDAMIKSSHTAAACAAAKAGGASVLMQTVRDMVDDNVQRILGQLGA